MKIETQEQFLNTISELCEYVGTLQGKIFALELKLKAKSKEEKE